MSDVLEELHRDAVASLDAILGKRLPVLDDGFVRVVDYMGSDVAIVQAARISYGKGTKTIQEDRGLIRYLMAHRHTTPFEMCEIKLHVRVPMDSWRQWIRHRTANVNEYSTRYSLAIDAAQVTSPEEWRIQSGKNKQGSQGEVDSNTGTDLSRREREFQKFAREIYEERIAAGVAREQARKDLPLSTYTEAYWKCDLHNLLHFLSLRMDSHAQEEIRAYATVIGTEIVARWCPIAWEAFVDSRLNGMTLTGTELDLIKNIIGGEQSEAIRLAKLAGFLKEDGTVKRSRGRDEFEGKLLQLGIKLPW
jgi:thymidylate synthase (FAD)